MITKTDDQTKVPLTDGFDSGTLGGKKEQPLCIVGGGVTLGYTSDRNSPSTVNRPPRAGNKSYRHPPCTPRPYATALPRLGGEGQKKNGVRGFAVFGKHKALHSASDLSLCENGGDKAGVERYRHSARAKFAADFYAFDSIPMEDFRQGGFSLMVRGGNSSSSFPSSRSVRSVCSSEDLIVTSIKLSRDGEEENASRSDRHKTVSSKHDICSSDSEQSFLEEISPGRFLINGKEVRMPEVPPPSMRSYYKPYSSQQTNTKASPRSNFERLRRPQRLSPRPRTFCAPEEANDPPQFVPIQLTKSNKVTVAFENYLNTNAKPKSAKLHRRPDARSSPAKSRDGDTDDRYDSATPRVHFDVKSMIRKYAPGGQQTLAGRIVDSNDVMVDLNRAAEQSNDADVVGVSDSLGLESDEISKATLINQWLDDCIDQQKNKRTLVLSFPSIGEEAEGQEGEEGEEEE